MPEGARQYLYLDLTLTQKFLRTLGPRGATLTDHVCAPSNGFRAAVYDSIGPPLKFMIINSGPRWLPEPETFGSSRGGGAAQRRSWPSAAILRLASKSCASLSEESSRPR
jgi:hypothetical protein